MMTGPERSPCIPDLIHGTQEEDLSSKNLSRKLRIDLRMLELATKKGLPLVEFAPKNPSDTREEAFFYVLATVLEPSRTVLCA